MSDLAVSLLEFLKTSSKALTIKQINSSDAFFNVGLREIARALLELQSAALIERTNVGNDYVYAYKSEAKPIQKEMSIDEYKALFEKQKIADNYASMILRTFVTKRSEIEEEFKRNVYRHKYLMDDKAIATSDDEGFKTCKQNFINDLNTMAKSLENLITTALKDYQNFDSDTSGLMRVNYLKEVRQCFNIIYSSSIKNEALGLDLSYVADETVYRIEEEFKVVYMHAKKELVHQKEMYETYQYNVKAEQAKVYGVSVKVLDKHILYLEAKRVYEKAEDAASYNKAKTKFMAVGDYLDAKALAKRCEEKYNSILKDEKLKLVLKEFYDKQDEINKRLEVIEDRLKLVVVKYNDKSIKLHQLEDSLDKDMHQVNDDVNEEIIKINAKIKSNMDRFNDLIDRRVNLIEEAEKLIFIQYRRKKDIENRIDKISADIDKLNGESRNLENIRDNLIKDKVNLIAEPKKKIESLRLEIKELHLEISKLHNEKSKLTSEYLTLQNTLNIKKAEYH